ncbi:uncharacterized protein GLRG_00947 [Colletotrichum graminicola M1.001]|uniref:Uncharacterized protein n=1 Tax=Colletotrichum graminicola (strain M1.001 / M2 / FGSC 10212) TaxID=645133 RepID=E3Q536_COLGM|nr:uncharacterized protein GLRG_00947 [Colletotrichum graminicola M1.001]EFQ25803.1 hypothetical protein GLRG_00947 [Colletotrichum graminicola M1.001]
MTRGIGDGVYGDQPRAPYFPGQGSFHEQTYHSEYYKTSAAISDVEGHEVMVIGCAISGYVSAGFLVRGAEEVAMVHRHPGCSIFRHL